MVFHCSPNMKFTRKPMFSWVASKYIFETFYSMTAFFRPSTWDLLEEARSNFFLLEGIKIDQVAQMRFTGRRAILHTNSPQVHGHKLSPTNMLVPTRPYWAYACRPDMVVTVSQFIPSPRPSCLEFTCNVPFHICIFGFVSKQKRLVLRAQFCPGIEWERSDVYFYRSFTFGKLA